MLAPVTTIVFDLGGVLIDWDPRYVYRDLFAGDTEAMDHFLTTVCTPEWNFHQDAGRSFAEATALLKTQFPDQAPMIDAWYPGFNKMLGGPIAGTVDILKALKEKAAVPLYALTNWSAETFPIAQKRFDFLRWFKGIVVSGVEKLAKPDRGIFDVLCKRYALDPAATLFIDDFAPNIRAANDLKFQTIHFTSPEALRSELIALNLLPL